MGTGERIGFFYFVFRSPGATGFTMSVTPIPEPATVALLGLGLLTTTQRRRRDDRTYSFFTNVFFGCFVVM